MDEALKYYGWKRFSSGVGVTQPCQLRSIYYFEAVMNGLIVAPSAKKLKALVCSPVPNMSSDGCRPYLDITNNKDSNVIYTSRSFDPQPRYYSTIGGDTSFKIEFLEGEEPVLVGDVHLLLKSRGVISDSLICRVAFNTAFVGPTLTLTKQTISPDKMKKDSRLGKDFLLHLVFEPLCRNCSRTTKLDGFCSECYELLKHDIAKWRSIHLNARGRPTVISPEDGIRSHYTPEQLEKEEINKKRLLELTLKFDSANYKIKPLKTAVAMEDEGEERKASEEFQVIPERALPDAIASMRVEGEAQDEGLSSSSNEGSEVTARDDDK